MAEYVAMYHCIECGEDVEARECYEDMGVLMHAMGVTGQAEPHETGSEPGDVKRVDIQQFANPNPVPKTPDIRPLAVRDMSAYLVEKFGLTEAQAVAHAESLLNYALRQFWEAVNG